MRPASAAWMARGRSVTSLDLKTKALPPDSIAVSMSAGSSRPVKNTIFAGAPTFFRQRAASKPSITGIRRSSTRTSGCSRNVVSIACSPFITEPTTSNWASRSRETARRICSLSSASNTRGFFNGRSSVLTVEIALQAYSAGGARVATGRTTGRPFPGCSQAAAPKTPPSLKLLESGQIVVAPQQLPEIRTLGEEGDSGTCSLHT